MPNAERKKWFSSFTTLALVLSVMLFHLQLFLFCCFFLFRMRSVIGAFFLHVHYSSTLIRIQQINKNNGKISHKLEYTNAQIENRYSVLILFEKKENQIQQSDFCFLFSLLLLLLLPYSSDLNLAISSSSFLF